MSDGRLAGSVADYKRLLQAVCDNRPSGTRGRLARALGTHRSFISQLTNPLYAMPIPVPHLETIFEVCHFSPAERAAFLAAYDHAHPGRRAILDHAVLDHAVLDHAVLDHAVLDHAVLDHAVLDHDVSGAAARTRAITVTVPDFADPAKNHAIEDMLGAYARQLIRLVDVLSDGLPS